MLGRRMMIPSSNLFFRSLVPRRYKSKVHWAKLAKKVTSTQKALNYFDDFYGNVYGKHWPSIRVALLTQSKYVALVNNFSDVERIVPALENIGAIDVQRMLECQMERIAENPSRPKKAAGRKQSTRSAGGAVAEMAEAMKTEELKSVYPEGAEALYDQQSSPAENNAATRIIDPSVSKGVGGLYEFVPATVLKGKEDWVPESDHFRYYATEGDNFPVVVEEQKVLEFPKQLKVFSFITGCCDLFPRPRISRSLEVTDYFLMDGASILPIIALDLKPGDNFLDMCAAPGGKSLVALQTLYLNLITMNDVSISRRNRLQNVMRQFILNFDERLKEETIRITNTDGRNIEDTNLYNKILVDVPCTTDRHSVSEDDNNIFNSSRVEERIKIPELQSSLLVSALKLVKVGGSVVYSTCSLSPIQNDGVVHMALKTVHEQSSRKIVVIDMTKALEPTKVMFRYHSNVLRYGHLVVPYLPDNYGPMYFCKLVRLS